MSYQRRLPALALVAGLPAVLLALLFLWRAPWPTWARVVPSILLVGTWIALVAVLHHELVRPLQTLANVLAAFRGGTTRCAFGPRAPTGRSASSRTR